MANGTPLKAEGYGKAVIPLSSGILEIPHAQYVPEISNSLVSMTPYLQLGYSIVPSSSGFNCIKDNNCLMTRKFFNNVLTIDIAEKHALATLNALDRHRAMGHPNNKYLSTLFPSLNLKEFVCPDCLMSKMTKNPFPGHFPSHSSPLECIHMDVCGPITPPSRGGNKYFLKIIDGFSRYAFIYPIRNKSDSFDHFIKFLNKAECASGHKVKSVVSDNGGEFVNHLFDKLFQERGIQHLKTAPYTPQQNPFAKRGNRTTVEKA